MAEKQEFNREYLIQYSLGAGMTFEQIEHRLAELPDAHPDKAHYIDKFLAVLPEDRREEFEQRLRPTV